MLRITSKAKVISLDAVSGINEVETSPASTAGAHAELLHKLHTLFNRKRKETGNIKLAQIGDHIVHTRKRQRSNTFNGQ